MWSLSESRRSKALLADGLLWAPPVQPSFAFHRQSLTRFRPDAVGTVPTDACALVRDFSASRRTARGLMPSLRRGSRDQPGSGGVREVSTICRAR